MQKTLSLLLFTFTTFIGFSQVVPVASNVSAATVKNTNASIHLVASDADFDSLTYSIVSNPSNGTATLSGDTVTYTPTTDFLGTDTFTFKGNDGEEDSETRTVTIKVVKGYLSIPNQIGADIDGEAAGDKSGTSVSFSSDGTTLAIGAYGNDGNGADSGHVRVYKYDGTIWTQLGSDIDGEAAGDYLGRSVSLSSDGTTLAIGAYRNDGNGADSGHVRIYKYNGTTWTQLGSDIDGEAAVDNSGFSVSLSSDGTTLAIGAIFNDGNGNGAYSGHVRIYKYDGTTWTQLGSDINGEAAEDQSGFSVSLSSDGTTLAIGAYRYDGNGPDSGYVRIYKYDGTTWTQLGSDINEEAASDYLGRSVSLSSDGTTLAIGALLNDGNGNDSGHVRIYKYDGTTWTQLGSDIDGEAAEDQSGFSVSLSSDGTTLAIGAYRNDGNGADSGHVRIYKYDGTTWTQLGSDIDGEAAEDQSGFSVSLSSDGTTLAIGAYRNDGNGADSGHVRVYNLVNSVSAVNEPPVANAQNIKTKKDTPLEIKLTGSDPEDDPLTYLIKTLPINGILKEGTNTILASELPKLLPADSLTYVPNANFVGDDSFDFIINANFLNSFSKANGLEFITQGGVPVTFQKPAGKTYYLIQETGSKMDWPDAKTLTDSFKGAQMFVPFNETMDKAIYDALKDMNRLGSSQNTKKPYWYGLSQDRNASDYSEPSGGWYWADGVKLGSAERPYTNWHSGEPNNGGNEEDHAQFNRFWGGFTWNDMAPGNTQSYALFEFSISDSSDSNPATISIEVKSVNSPPIANDQSLKTNKGTPLKIKLTGSDPEDDPLTYLIKTLPSNGILKEGNNTILASELPKLLPADSLSYVPNANFSGNDSFDFIINANFLNSFTKANGLKYIAQDGVPVTYQKPEGKTYFLIQEGTGVSGNPIDWTTARDLTNTIEGAKMYVVLNAEMELLVWNGLKSMGLTGKGGLYYWLGLYQDKTSPDYAEPGLESQNWGGWTWVDGVTLKDRGYHNWYNYPSEPNQAGAEDYAQFEFSSTGPNGIQWNDMSIGNAQSWPLFEFSINENTNSNTATISIEVQNLIPLADSQTVTFSEGSINNAITLTGSDPQSNAITYILNTIPEKGILKVGGLALGDLPLTVGPGDLTYDPPNENYFGEQSFKFKVNNGEDDSAPATVTIIVKNVNDPPEGDPGDYSTKEDVPIDIIHVGRDKDLVNIFTVHTQMGTTLPQPSSVALGESMALSADGKRLILGAYNCPQCNNSFAQVYNWNGTDWDQLGATLDGDTTTDNFGEYVSISSDGNRIAVAGYSNDNANGADAGHVKVFDWDGTTWNSVGSPILGDKANDKFGYRGLHLSGDGNSMVIPSFRGGYLHTYNWNGIKWNKTGSITIVPNSTSEIPGQVYLSMDGNRLAVGSISDGTNGQVKIYDWNGTSWIQFTSIDGSAKLFGCTIDFSRDGKKLIVGEKASSLTRVYDLSGSSAVQIGSDIDFSGQQAAFFWRYVSISDDGNRVGIPVVSKKLGVFDWDGTSWNQLGEDVLATGLMGESFDMSSDGKIMAAGGHFGPNKVFNILNLEYIITTLPLNGTLKEGTKTLVAGDLPYTLTTSDQKLSYIPNNNYFGTDSYLFKLNDGKADSTNSLNGNREDSKVTITIEEFILTLPSNYKTTTIESCEGSDVGILDIEVAATTFRKTGTTVDIPITYNVAIEGLGNVGTIVSPNKTLQVKDLAKGTYELKFTIVGEPKYVHPKIEFTIDEIPTPTVYDVGKIEVCDDAVDGDDLNGKAKFDTSTIINGMLKDPNTGVVQDANLLDIEFTYFDQATNASVSAATLPNPFYSASQTVTVKLTSKANTSCIGVGSVVFVVNALPVFERIDDTKFVCLNLDAVTIGVKSSDIRTYSYTWTRNGTAFNLNIPGSDSTVLIGLGGDYEVTATTTDGTNCTQVLKFNIGESDIATVLKKDIIIADLNPGPNNTITVLTETLGIGDYEFAIDDVSGPYQDEPTFENVRPGLHTIYIRDKNECGVVNIKSLVIGYKKFFTPNGDGIHDTWNIIGLTKTSLPNSKIYIFDRFGKLLKELDPLGPGWDGTFIGKSMPSTDYWFRVVLEDGREFKSHFSLVRDWD